MFLNKFCDGTDDDLMPVNFVALWEGHMKKWLVETKTTKISDINERDGFDISDNACCFYLVILLVLYSPCHPATPVILLHQALPLILELLKIQAVLAFHGVLVLLAVPVLPLLHLIHSVLVVPAVFLSCKPQTNFWNTLNWKTENLQM